MGGSGSGKSGGKTAVEDCVGFSTADLLRYDYLKESAAPYAITWSNCLGHWLYTLTFDVLAEDDRLMLYLRQSMQNIWLESTLLNFGGRRWWFKCPQCERRCATLHKPPGVWSFACRICCDLTYRSSLESHGGSVFGLPPGAIAKARRARRPRWVRKRDRRADYKPRGWRLLEMRKRLGLL